MRLFLLSTSLMILLAALPASSATDEVSFEKSLQKFGKKLDEAKAKGQKLGEEAQKDWKEIQSKTEKATDELATKSEAKGKDWQGRLKGAFTEFGAGVKNAWEKLKGDS